MSKGNRLSRADFSALKTLRKETGRFFVLSVAKSPDGKARLATVVSKKTAKRAVERNLIKRRLRAAIRHMGPVQPFAFIFTAKRAATQASFHDVLADVKSLIVKVSAGLKGTVELQ